MTTYKSEFMQVMQERGFIHQCTDAEGLDARLAKDRTVAYIGFDCTAPSLHVGSLIQIMALRWLQKTGHRPLVLMGGGTTKVGDPSGKDEARKVLSNDDIHKNLESIKEIFSHFLSFGAGGTDAMMLNNAEWLDKLNYIDFLRDFGRYFSVNRMLTQDSVKMRLEREQNLSFLEFNYMVLQAYDFVELSQRYNCMLQIGGSDQWGNIVMGIDLQRRTDSEKRFQPLDLKSAMLKGAKVSGGGDAPASNVPKVVEVQPMIQSKRTDPADYTPEAFMNYLNKGESRTLFGLTTPLLTTSSGAKMGKTANGAVWLNKDMLSAYDYWQFWRNTEDADVGRFLRLFTELPIKEIQKLEALGGSEINEAKKVLANEATRLCHGERAAKQSAETARKTFEEGTVSENLPTFDLKQSELGKGMAAYELFRLSGLADSGGEARRLIRGGGARINDRKLEDENALVGHEYFDKEQQIKLSAGRKKHMLVRLIK